MVTSWKRAIPSPKAIRNCTISCAPEARNTWPAIQVDEIQEVYRFQGVGIDDKHIEVSVRQMLKKVTILDSGGTSFLVGEQVDKSEFKAENQRTIAEGRVPATAEPLVLGITQASLTTIHLGFLQKPPRCSPKPRSRARWTICAASRKTSSWAA